jgi:hypothetical protein
MRQAERGGRRLHLFHSRSVMRVEHGLYKFDQDILGNCESAIHKIAHWHNIKRLTAAPNGAADARKPNMVNMVVKPQVRGRPLPRSGGPGAFASYNLRGAPAADLL